jgi:DNA repair photolyase
MMPEEIQVKTILNTVPQPDTWFGLKYNMNLYRGCQHQCIYCDSRSTCYGIENFAHIQVKINAIDLLEEVLPRKRVIGTIGTGSMNDPYMPVEQRYNLAGRALQVIARHGFPVHVITKSDLVLKDLETLRQISQVFAAVSFTITTSDDALGKKLEPGAPLVSARLRAIQQLSTAGIQTGVTMMPILPFIEDTRDNIVAIVRLAHDHGAHYILPWMGMTLRDGSRDYYYAQLDRLYPGMKERYQRCFSLRYTCDSPHAQRLYDVFQAECDRLGLATRMPLFMPGRIKHGAQLSLF